MKKYTVLYNTIKEMILSGQLCAGDKIPSVRKAAEIYSVSRTTVLNAYFDLCADGYIIAHEKSGYFVSSISSTQSIVKEDITDSTIKYDLTGGTADADSFDISLWQRYIKSALRQNERLLSYSEPKGEYDLRCAIASYIKEKRNVIASPDRIIIGAGVQPLLQILCSLIERDKIISFPDSSFVQGINTFEGYGFNVHTRDKDADIIYVSPSHMTRWGDVMPIKRRLELVKYSKEHNSLVIEDDYENDFLYNVKPTPSLYALGNGNVVYIGSFSAMLLPAIRISFIVLTEELTKAFNKKSHLFAQTASKTEQIALAQYIRDGHINSQTRKIRRLYTAKTKAFYNLLKKHIHGAEIEIGENTLQIIMSVRFNKELSIFEKYGLKVFAEDYKNGRLVLTLSPAGIPNEELENVSIALKKAIE